LQKRDEYAQKRIEKESQTTARIALVNEAALQEELGALDLQYAKGLIKEEDYQKKREDIVTKHAVEQAQASLDAAKAILEDPNLSPESRLKLEEEIAQKEIDLANAVRDAEITAAQQSADAQKRKIENIAGAIEQASQMLGALSDFASTLYEGQIQKLDEQQESPRRPEKKNWRELNTWQRLVLSLKKKRKHAREQPRTRLPRRMKKSHARRPLCRPSKRNWRKQRILLQPL
jgi:hypothetical protein